MEHTWQTHHLPKLEISHLAAGDVALCGSFVGRDSVLSGLDEKRISFVAPLGSRSDVEWLLRGLHMHPNIRHVMVIGDDARMTGEALLALWHDGLDADGRMLGSRGRLSPELGAEAVDALRKSVRLSDMRGKSLNEVAASIAELPEKLAPSNQSQSVESSPLPNPEIPERNVFLSRKTTFPIFSSGVGDSWLQLLNLALKIGTEKQTSTGERMAEALNAVITIETPVLEDGEHEEPGFPEFFDFNAEDFKRYRVPPFEERPHGWGGVDPLEVVFERLSKSRDTCSASMVFLEPKEYAAAGLVPDLISATFNVVDEKLYGSFVFRSVDLYNDWPIEALALEVLQRELAGRLGLATGSLTFMIHSAYLIDQDWARSQRVLEEFFKRPLPLHVDPSGVFLFGNDGGSARAMLLNHDASHIMWENAFSDPEDLSWYIVDVMPWLLPQHIRYVGQECAALMRAMKEKECYLQG